MRIHPIFLPKNEEKPCTKRMSDVRWTITDADEFVNGKNKKTNTRRLMFTAVFKGFFLPLWNITSYYIMFLVLFHFLALRSHRSMVFGQIISEFLVWRLCEDGFFPQIWGQVGIGFGNCSVSCLSCKVKKIHT